MVKSLRLGWPLSMRRSLVHPREVVCVFLPNFLSVPCFFSGRTDPRSCYSVIAYSLLVLINGRNTDSLQVAIDISGSGRLTLPYPRSFDTGINNITIFLFSYDTGLNLTISNGTSVGWNNASTLEPEEFDCGRVTKEGWANAGCEPIMSREPSSTVKHVNWAYPDCLVGNGDGGGFRGMYNVGCPNLSL